jgi:hypothetical protein
MLGVVAGLAKVETRGSVLLARSLPTAVDQPRPKLATPLLQAGLAGLSALQEQVPVLVVAAELLALQGLVKLV